MKWLPYNKDKPPLSGKYVVKTESQVWTNMGILRSTHKLEPTFSGKTWACTNQEVTHYLNETHYNDDDKDVV